ncbi:hypothetical protein FOCC_FOCC011037 [Frankliniella occidentalis]|nr:hypothetical protein FOCC_FOCC011037 [Frankliniella occidentalis]
MFYSYVFTAWVMAVAMAQGGIMPHQEDPYTVPKQLLIGAGVSALQTEGAWNSYGKAESAADHVLHLGKLGMKNPHAHDVAADSYHKFREDIRMAALLKLKLYRFSFSWSRLLPKADVSEPNTEGVKFYHEFIDEILRYNMTPLATLYHFDHPQLLETMFKGFQGEEIVSYFTEYSRFVFEEYGSKVQLWTTINEPNVYCTYFPHLFLTSGLYSPEDIDPYKCTRHTILAHAHAYREFKTVGHKGMLGFTATLVHGRPASNSPEDVYAADVYNLAQAGTVLHPVRFGDYPQPVKDVFGSKLQPFSEEEKRLINGTADFFGFNVYFSMSDISWKDPDANSTIKPSQMLAGLLDQLKFVSVADTKTEQTSEALYSTIYPETIRDAVLWAWNTYKLPIIITENGLGDYHLGKADGLRAAYYSPTVRACPYRF